MSQPTETALEETRETLLEHVEAALEHADDEKAVFHLRHAKQLAIDMSAVAEQRAAERDGTDATNGRDDAEPGV